MLERDLDGLANLTFGLAQSHAGPAGGMLGLAA
jgi:hypothetical protein